MGWLAAEKVAQHGPLCDDIPLWSRQSLAAAFSIVCKRFIAAREAKVRDNKEIGEAVLAMLTAHADLLPVLNTTRDGGKDGKPSFHKALFARFDEYCNAPQERGSPPRRSSRDQPSLRHAPMLHLQANPTARCSGQSASSSSSAARASGERHYASSCAPVAWPMLACPRCSASSRS